MDELTDHQGLRRIALAAINPIHRLAAEIEWQLTRLTTWLRDEP